MTLVAKSIKRECKDLPNIKYEAGILISTGELVLSQVKLLLDKNMITKEIFQTVPEKNKFNRTVLDAFNLLKK